MTLNTLRKIALELLKLHGDIELVLDPDMDPEAVQDFKIEVVELDGLKFAFITTKTATKRPKL